MKSYYLLYLLVLTFLYSCSDLSNEPDSSTIEHTITVTTNQNFTFELDVHADGGYQWDYSISDTAVAWIDSTSYRPKSGDWSQVGGVTIETFYFSGKRKGHCIINLIEHRSWEINIAPINTVQIRVIVI